MSSRTRFKGCMVNLVSVAEIGAPARFSKFPLPFIVWGAINLLVFHDLGSPRRSAREAG
jgi:hypothetical protein